VHNTVSYRKKIIWYTGGLFASCIAAYSISTFGILAGAFLLLLPLSILFVVISFNNPVTVLYTLFFFSFFVFAVGRYLTKGAFPAGSIIDILIIYTCVIIFLKNFSHKIACKNVTDAPVLIFIVWFLYCFTTLFNRQSPGFSGWLSGVRPFLYVMLTVPLFCILLNRKNINTFLILWGVFSMILTLKGFIQLNIGLDVQEKKLLAEGMARTHLLWGKLRVFSLLSDAGQFGAQQANAGICGAILFLGEKNIKKRLFYLAMCLTGIYGMFISGTRTAMFILLAGGAIYLLVIRNVRLLLAGVLCGGVFLYIMMFTYIGQGNYNIRRMRTSFRPDTDASYLVRKSNQQLFREYFASRPFGGGIGSMQPGIPGTFLGDTPPDSGLVLIWGEQGIVGLCLFLGILLYIMLKGTYEVWFKIKNERLRMVLVAMICSVGGMAVGHYGNPVFLQHPSTLTNIFAIALIFSASRIDREIAEKKPEI
jgi:hypothetical protein